MKALHWFILTLCVFVMWGCKEEESSPTETTELSNQNTAQYASFGVGVELLSRQKYNNYVAATFNFQYATRDDSVLVHNDWDLEYGNGGNGDKLSVRFVTDDKSSLADLGLIRFETLADVPIAGNFQKEAIARLGHVYVVHVSDDDADFYAKFIITSMSTGDKITINWVRSDNGVTFQPFSLVTGVNYETPNTFWGAGVEIFSRHRYDDYLNATYSFEYGSQGANSPAHGDWDILYDNVYWITPTDTMADQIDVNTVTDDKSLITDLGTAAFDSVRTIPLGTDYSDHAVAVPGHVYVVHTKDTNSDFYTKFVVTAMKKKDWIRINWVRSADGLSFK